MVTFFERGWSSLAVDCGKGVKGIREKLSSSGERNGMDIPSLVYTGNVHRVNFPQTTRCRSSGWTKEKERVARKVQMEYLYKNIVHFMN